ncbi:hypothetical protein HY085_01385 [Candidatus Gottesmanbacteria bacterium]|nr:hypothetical protein [Candidatus Gottesmanbacteria bacterium]
MEKRTDILSVITTPLGFFALALLIVEGFLGIVVIGPGSSLDPGAKLLGMWMAIGAFAGVTLIVALMVWKIPKHLTLRGQDWMDEARMSKSWADSINPATKEEVDKLKSTTSKK